MMPPSPVGADPPAPPTDNLRRILDLRDSHTGRQACVLCPGPSIETIDFDLLTDHPCLVGVNGVYLLRNRFKFYFCSSPNFFVPNMRRIAAVDADLFFLSSFIRHAVELLPAEVQDKTIVLDVDASQMAARRPSDDFHFDLTRTLSWGPTVLLDLVLPALLWMGFSEIVLVGADYPLRGYRRFYTGRIDAPRTLREIDHVAEMELAHRRFDQLSRILSALPNPVRIWNCSPGSQLTQFVQRRLEDVIAASHVQQPRCT